MQITQTVSVRSIVYDDSGTITVEASNGNSEGPPFVRFILGTSYREECFIGKKYDVVINDHEEVTPN